MNVAELIANTLDRHLTQPAPVVVLGGEDRRGLVVVNPPFPKPALAYFATLAVKKTATFPAYR